MGGSIPSKPQKKFSHPLGNSLYHEKVKSQSLAVKSETKNSGTSEQTSVVTRKKDKQKLYKRSGTLKEQTYESM